MNKNSYCVIMAGGLGKRFWPVSNKACPKQFCDIMNTGKSFLRQTFERANQIFDLQNIIIVTGTAYEDITKKQIPEIPTENILKEPFGKNTAPCIAYAAYKIARTNPEASMVVVPSDHFIFNDKEYIDNITKGLDFVEQYGGLLTIGIKPTRPETGYGYIQIKKNRITEYVSKVKTFTEKPDKELAKVFMESGDFLWNAGIFIWKVKEIINEFKNHLEDLYLLFENEYKNAEKPDSAENISHIYSQSPNVSIDFGIMEKSSKVYVIKGEFGWSDVGTWHSFHEISPKDENQNVSNNGNVLFIDSKECIVCVPHQKKVIVEGIDNCIIAEQNDYLMICTREHENNIRHFEDMLKQKGALK
ncbi:mannose-1-phosphate guanylyltransferase [Gabonibacter massiliensis]|uniref:mannose-1-phosphate guanylyltransferase n=1 Tax=Gabonibacter massiliensis TaxID=1720195 RepID=UPI00073F6035|nr:mannose-1-phosphate guanylyltransferase [Gabonibacter massiliensis]